VGSPGARNPHAGKYEESTSSRQRGGSGGNATPLPTEFGRFARQSQRDCNRSSPGLRERATLGLRPNKFINPERVACIHEEANWLQGRCTCEASRKHPCGKVVSRLKALRRFAPPNKLKRPSDNTRYETIPRRLRSVLFARLPCDDFANAPCPDGSKTCRRLRSFTRVSSDNFGAVV